MSRLPAAEDFVKLYTDGACSGNPGPGGWAFILEHPATGKILEKFGADPHTTNNRMEIESALRGLEILKRPCRVELVTDSQYLAKGINEWLPGWRANGYRRREGNKLKPLQNDDLWRAVDALLARHQVRVVHVKGHAGHPQNERCDQLAVAAYKSLGRRSAASSSAADAYDSRTRTEGHSRDRSHEPSPRIPERSETVAKLGDDVAGSEDRAKFAKGQGSELTESPERTASASEAVPAVAAEVPAPSSHSGKPETPVASVGELADAGSARKPSRKRTSRPKKVEEPPRIEVEPSLFSESADVSKAVPSTAVTESPGDKAGSKAAGKPKSRAVQKVKTVKRKKRSDTSEPGEAPRQPSRWDPDEAESSQG